MSFRFLSHQWEMQDVEDGILVTLAHRDLDALTTPVLVDELYDLVLENGQRNLYLDFGRVHFLASVVVGKLLALDNRLRTVGGRLALCNVPDALYESLRAARVTETLDVRAGEYQNI